MPPLRRRPAPGRRLPATLALTGLALSTALLSGCTTSRAGAPGATQSPDDAPSTSSTPALPPAQVTTSPSPRAQQVPVDSPVEVAVSDGDLRSVTVTSGAGRLAGKLAADGGTWTSTGRLQPGTRYTVAAVAENGAGEVTRSRSVFRTVRLTLDQQTYPSVAPLQGETVGVGMPVIVTFDVPVTDHAAFERHLSVTSTPRQRGSWYWLSDTEVHWRPDRYWRAGSHVTVDVDVDSVPAGNGIYGQLSRSVSFDVGDAHISRVNAQTHQMAVNVNGALVRTIPITTGKAGFTTRSGTKVIIEKYRRKQMNSETVGIGEDDPEYYNIDDVEYAMRVTYSGEFIHAAPWSVGSQGYANVSHGCTGMSTDNARWLYDLSRRGDVVEYTGTDRAMTFTNGYGDWNISAKAYHSGSAL